jgi:hypothetical protein
MITKPPYIPLAKRRKFEADAKRIRIHGFLKGCTRDEIVDEIMKQVPIVTLLEAHRFANGWTRRELSIAVDFYYSQSGFMAPELTSAAVCSWEHGGHLPSRERQDVLCWVYRTRPDRLGFGVDYSDLERTQFPPHVALDWRTT